jgi:hypothetical protein
MEEEEMNELGNYKEAKHKDKMEEQEGEMEAEEAEVEMPDEAPTDEAAEEVTISDDEAEALIDAHNAADEVVAKLEDAMAGEPSDDEADDEADEEADEEEEVMDADLMEPEEEAGDEEPMMEGEEVMEELYEAALSGLNIDIEKKSKEELVNEVKKAIFQRVVRRLIKESKSK